MSLCNWHISLSRMSSRSICFYSMWENALPPFGRLSAPACGYALFCFFTYSLVETWAASTLMLLWSRMFKYHIETLLSVPLPVYCPSFIFVARIKYLDLKQREKRIYSAYSSRPQPSIGINQGRPGCYCIQHCFWLRIPLHSQRNMEGQWRMLLVGSQVGLMLG